MEWNEHILLPFQSALKFLDDCEKKETRLSSCEAFEIEPNGAIRSLPNEGLDMTGKEFWDYSVEELCEVVRDHIRPRSRMLFELS